MRELTPHELPQVSGAAWWSTSNIMAAINGFGKTPDVKVDWVSPYENVPVTEQQGIAIGFGIMAIAAVAVGVSLITIMGVSAVGMGSAAVASQYLTRKI